MPTKKPATKRAKNVKAFRLPPDLIEGLDAFRRKLAADDPDRGPGEITESEALRRALRRFFREQGLIKP